VTGHVETLQADVTAEAEMLDMAQAVVDQFQRVDMVVNSAGIIGPTSTTIPDYSLDDFRRVLDVNLMGSFNVTKYAIKAMQPQGYGRILLLASIAGKEGNPGMVGYATSKAGVIGLVKSVAKEYADTQITVNGLAPALIATPMLDDATEAQLDYLKSKIPMGRLGTIDEIAALSCWIISKESSFTTGAIFDISGGRATY
jgi:3-oxoacyl-[acyl-carrier protein] reductase